MLHLNDECIHAPLLPPLIPGTALVIMRLLMKRPTLCAGTAGSTSWLRRLARHTGLMPAAQGNGKVGPTSTLSTSLPCTSP